MRVLLTCILALATGSGFAEYSAICGSHYPDGNVQNCSKIAWKVAPTGGGRVSRVEMRLNDRLVPATFNATAGAVEYTADPTLKPGHYVVGCRVTIERQVTVRQDWSFEVGASSTSADIFERLNLFRRDLGLPAFVRDPRIDSAAVAHSAYQVHNGLTCHEEDPAMSGFTGRTPTDRMQHFGFKGTCFEGACGNQVDPVKAVQLLFDAPYHRIAFLQPGAPAVGIGFESTNLTIDYALSTEESSGLSPAPGQTGIPLSWDGNESPCPLRIHSHSGPTGYPILFGWFSPRMDSIRDVYMRLTGPDGREIPALLNTPQNDDELRSCAILTPKSKLLANTTYSVEAHATTGRGKRIGRSWSFTTEATAK